MPCVTQSGYPQRVLVVEDSALVALDIEMSLEDEGFEVVGPAATLAEALRLAETDGLSCALLDLDLNGEDAGPVAARLHDRGIPVLCSSGSSSPTTLPPGTVSLPKPFSRTALSRALADLLH